MTLLESRRGRRRARNEEKNGRSRARESRRRGRPLRAKLLPGRNERIASEFNMAPRGSFNHLIESPACLGSPPFAPRLPPRLVIVSNEYLRKGRRLLKDEFARVFFLPSSPLLPLFLFPVARTLEFSPAISGRTRGEAHRVRIGIRGQNPGPATL